MQQMIPRNLIYRIDKCSGVRICYKRSGNNCVYYIQFVHVLTIYIYIYIYIPWLNIIELRSIVIDIYEYSKVL